MKVGADISESIIPTTAIAEDFMPVLENIDDLDLGETNPTHFIDIIKSSQSKSTVVWTLMGSAQNFSKELHWKLADQYLTLLIA